MRGASAGRHHVRTGQGQTGYQVRPKKGEPCTYHTRFPKTLNFIEHCCVATPTSSQKRISCAPLTVYKKRNKETYRTKMVAKKKKREGRRIKRMASQNALRKCLLQKAHGWITPTELLEMHAGLPCSRVYMRCMLAFLWPW
jgi:hypothetical protein